MFLCCLFCYVANGNPMKHRLTDMQHGNQRTRRAGHGDSKDVRQALRDIQRQNQLRSEPPLPRRHKRRWSQIRSEGDLPKPAPQEEEEPFILDLKNFPDLANADLGSQNPNIQVTIEVVDNPQMEIEMDLAKESRNDWSLSRLEENGEDLSYEGEDSLLSGVGADWNRRWKSWDSMDNYEYEEEEWSDWSPCSVTCGHGNQKRIRSCGYACTATESRTCDLERCPGETVSCTSLLTIDLDLNSIRCEKWLNCKNDFLEKYLHQVLTELPNCPCIYPSEVVYSAVNIFDRKLQKTYRWRDASGPKERLDIYKPSAKFCVRSMLSFDSTTLAAQHCCYDDHMKLITRGKGAGAPNLISTEFSPELHYKVDVLPWILCKGDWSRFHSVRPPNNGLLCVENPQEDVYMNELEEAREY
uniref:Isthmin 2a n=1 Tax=Sinocyclocheilus rhinocerous TaxID=307959 RepID=A0A673MF02_9TELE